MVRSGIYGRGLSKLLTAGLVFLWISTLITFVSASSIDNVQLTVCTENTTDTRCCLCDHDNNCTDACPDGFDEKNSTSVTCSGYSTTTQQTSTSASMSESTSESTSETTSESSSSSNSTSAESSIRICVKPCVKGEFYNDTESQCMPCAPECITCNGSQSNCIKCKYYFENKCFASCPSTTHVSKPPIAAVTTVAMTTEKQDVTTEGSVENSTNSSDGGVTVSTQGTEATTGFTTTVPVEAYDEGDQSDNETIVCIAKPGPTATSEPANNVKMIGGIAGAGVAVIVVMIIICVVVVRRRRADSCTTADGTKQKSRMSTLIDKKKSRKPVTNVEMGTGGQNRPRAYENMDTVNVGAVTIEQQADKVTRYVKDPTCNVEVERRKEPTNRSQADVTSSVYGNAAMVRLNEEMDLERMDQPEIQQALEKEEEKEELDGLGQAPALPGATKTDAKDKRKKTDIADLPAGPVGDYLDMSQGEGEEPYENIQIVRGNTKQSKSIGKPRLSTPAKSPNSGKTASKMVKSPVEVNGPQEDYEEMEVGGDDDLEEYENTGSMARGKVGTRVGTAKAGSKFAAAGSKVGKVDANAVLDDLEDYENTGAMARGKVDTEVDGVDAKSGLDDLEDYENTGAMSLGVGGAQRGGTGRELARGGDVAQEDGEELYENTMEDYENVQIRRN